MNNKIEFSEDMKRSTIRALIIYMRDYPDCVGYLDLKLLITKIKKSGGWGSCFTIDNMVKDESNDPHETNTTSKT